MSEEPLTPIESLLYRMAHYIRHLDTHSLSGFVERVNLLAELHNLNPERYHALVKKDVTEDHD
jgi:hypothetical protein